MLSWGVGVQEGQKVNEERMGCPYWILGFWEGTYVYFVLWIFFYFGRILNNVLYTF